MIRTATILVIGTALIATTALTPAAAAEVSFKGKRIDAVIGSSPGGGTDGTTRLVGRYLSNFLPGKPTIVYRNMPAAHGVQALNYVANSAKKDGTVWTGGSSSYVDANNLRKSVVEYNPTKFEYIGGVARGGSVIVMRKAKFANVTDKSKPPVIIGDIDGSRSWGQMMLWGKDALDWNVKFVIGYPGTAALAMAARRGEVDAFGTSSIKMHRDLSKGGEFDAFVQLGEVEGGKIVPRVSFPKVPTMPQLMEGKLSGDALAAFNFWVKTNQIDKWYALPPGTPKDVVASYRAAYGKVVADPDFLKLARLQFSEDFSPQKAEDVLDLISSTAYPDAKIFTYMSDMAVRHGLPAEPLSDAEMAKLAKARGRHPGLNTWLYLKQNGLNPDTDQVEIVREARVELPDGTKQVNRKSLEQMLVDGDIDACFMTQPKLEFVNRNGLKIIPIPAQPMVFFMTVSTSKKMVDTHPDVVKRVLKATMEGIAFFKQNREKTIQIIMEKHTKEGKLDRKVAEILYDDLAPVLEPNLFPGLDAVSNVYQEALKQDEKNGDAAKIHPLALWNFHFLREIEDSGFVRDLYKNNPEMLARGG